MPFTQKGFAGFIIKDNKEKESLKFTALTAGKKTLNTSKNTAVIVAE